MQYYTGAIQGSYSLWATWLLPAGKGICFGSLIKANPIYPTVSLEQWIWQDAELAKLYKIKAAALTWTWGYSIP